MYKHAEKSSILNDSTEKRNEVRPSYYSKDGIECIDIIRAWKLNFNLANALKYLLRCEYKENKALDIRKAIKYLEFELEEAESCLK